MRLTALVWLFFIYVLMYFFCLRLINCNISVVFLLSRHRGAVAVRQPYIRVVGIEEVNEASSQGHASFTQEEVKIVGIYHK